MGVLSCKILRGPGWRKASFDENYIAHYSEKYQIRVDDPTMGPRSVVVQASLVLPNPLPFRYAPYYDDFSALCRKVSVESGEEGKCWYATAEWDNAVDPNQNLQNPCDRPPKVSLKFAQFSRPIVRDKNGNLIATTAGQIILPALEIDDSRPVLTIERNEPTFPALTAIAYADAINTDEFYGAPPGTAKMQPPDIGDEQFENNVRFRVVRYEIHFNREGWEEPVLNRGTWFFDSSDNLIKLDAGMEPLLLKKDGTLLNGTGVPAPAVPEPAEEEEGDEDDVESAELDDQESGGGTGGAEDEESDDDPDEPYYLNPPRLKRMAFAPLDLYYSALPVT
ncbi:MAG TPA: hypothetical protein VGG64_29865 [Pirellulales bacterium]|jgi:hypothetical protein